MKLSLTHSRRFSDAIGPLQVAIIILVLITAGIHLQHGISMIAGGSGSHPSTGPGRGFPGGVPGGPGNRPPGAPSGGFRGGAPGFSILQWIPLPLSTLFILNGISYLVLITALYLPPLARFQRLIRWLLIIFAAVTFVLYFLVNGFHLDTISLIDKLVEIVLIILLLVADRQSVHAKRSEVLHNVSPQ